MLIPLPLFSWRYLWIALRKNVKQKCLRKKVINANWQKMQIMWLQKLFEIWACPEFKCLNFYQAANLDGKN
jgi:hypothetical protein